MAQLYLHAGLPKTATTAIQSWLASNREALRQIHVCAFPQRLAHRLAVGAITSPSRLARFDIPPILTASLEEANEALTQAYEDPRVNRVIVSSEYFSPANPAVARELFRAFDNKDTTVILVLRRQDRIIESGYNQRVRMAGSSELIPRPRYKDTLDWHRLATSWADCFGRENVMLFLYDELVKTQRSLVGQIFERVDPELSTFAETTTAPPRLVNQSLPASLIEFKRLANCASATAVLPLLEMASKRGAFGESFRLDPETAKAYLEIYQDSNRRVAREFFGSDGDLFDASDLEGAKPGVDYTGKLPVKAVAMLLALHIDETAKRIQEIRDDHARRLEACEAELKQLQAQLEAGSRSA